MTDDLATWLRSQLDHQADVHRKLVESEGTDLTSEREADPDGFWAVYDAHRAIIDRCGHIIKHHISDDFAADTLAEDVLRALGLAYQHADGYREEWRP